MEDFSASFSYMEHSLKIKIAIKGEDSPTLHNIYNGIFMCFIFNPELLTPEWADFIRRKLSLTAFVAGKDYPAAQQGLEGVYYIFEFENWNCATNDVFEFFAENQRLKGKPKDLLVYQNGIISEHHFDDVIGMRFEVTYTGEEGKKSLIDIYNQWKINMQ